MYFFKKKIDKFEKKWTKENTKEVLIVKKNHDFEKNLQDHHNFIEQHKNKQHEL